MNISTLGKFLDQPLLSNALSRKMPHILIGSAIAYGIKDTYSHEKKDRKESAIKNAIILGSIVAASIFTAKKVKIKGENLIEFTPKNQILKKQNKAIDEFLKVNTDILPSCLNILNKARSKMLSLRDTNTLLNDIKNNKQAKELVATLFSEKENITSGKILQEISKLSIMGFVPVLSGVMGGLAADKACGNLTKEKATNKVKEGIYQFIANIFLCNVGAGTFLFAAEKLNKAGVIKNLTPIKKTLAILSGILAVGVLGGSKIANFLGNNFINPVINKCTKTKNPQDKEERKPEVLDVALHTDDIATAGVLSGVKWIEPLLPVMYLVSGYRAAIGYRNNNSYSKLDKANIHQHN